MLQVIVKVSISQMFYLSKCVQPLNTLDGTLGLGFNSLLSPVCHCSD